MAKELEARKAPHIIEKGYEEANAKLKKVESHLEDIEALDGVDDEWLSGEYQNIEDCENALIEMTKQNEVFLIDDGFQEDAGNVPTTGVSRIPKQNFKKPSELEEQATLKDFDEWKKKLMDYYTLTGIDKCDEKVKVTTLRSYLSKHMHNILEFSIGIKDEDETTMDDVLNAIKKFIRSKRNVLLDRVEFERYRQKEGEDFESFYIATQQLAFDADLVNNHCADCSKKCLESRVANKLMAGIKDQEVRTKLLKVKEDDFSLENIVTICRTEENSRRNEQKLSSKNVNYLNRKPNELQRGR